MSFEDVRDRRRGELLRALEDQVLDEVGDAAELDRLEPGARSDPGPRGATERTLSMRRCHPQAVVQR